MSATLTARGAAKRVGVDNKTIRNAIAAGQLSGIRGAAGTWHLTPSDVDAWNARRLEPPRPDPLTPTAAHVGERPATASDDAIVGWLLASNAKLAEQVATLARQVATLGEHVAELSRQLAEERTARR